MGSDVILLIAACLRPDETRQLAGRAKELGLEVLLEIHDEKELAHVCEESGVGAEIEIARRGQWSSALHMFQGQVQVHQIRKLAQLDKPGAAQSTWAIVMVKKRRKTLVVCHSCHDSIHDRQPTAAAA